MGALGPDRGHEAGRCCAGGRAAAGAAAGPPRRHPGAGPGRPARAHREQHDDRLRLCRGGAAERHHHRVLRQPRDRQRGRRRRRGMDAGRRQAGAAQRVPDRAEHGARHLGAVRDRGRRPDAGADRRRVRPLAGSRGARREDGLRPGLRRRRAQPRGDRASAAPRAPGQRPRLRARVRGRLCRQRHHRHARGGDGRDRRRPAGSGAVGVPARRPARHAVAQPAGGDPRGDRVRLRPQAGLRVHRRPRRRRPVRLRAGLGGARGGGCGPVARAGLEPGLAAPRRRATAWTTRSAASAAADAPTWCCWTTPWRCSTPGTAAR